MMEVLNGRERFFIWQIILYGDALTQSYTKLGNHDFVSKFAERIEDSNLWFYSYNNDRSKNL